MKRYGSAWTLYLLLLPNLAYAVEGKAGIQVDKQCFELNEDYEVSFVNENQRVDDWIGFFPASESNDDLRNCKMWLPACDNSKRCEKPFLRDTVHVRAALPPGNWKVVLAREGGDHTPYDALAISDTFEVREVCEGEEERIYRLAKQSTSRENEIAFAALSSARNEIEQLIRQNSDLSPAFLRMGFHDCTGGCDGCIDLENPDNLGFEEPIKALQPIVEKYANVETGVSRADIWALATFVGCNMAQGSNRVNFSPKHLGWWGRVDCENAGRPCLGKDGQEVECSATKGPHREFPSVNILTDDLYKFFEDEFGFDEEDTVAIMGAHSLGRLEKEISGITGPHGWDRTNEILDSGYYDLLVGGETVDDPVEILVNEAPDWVRTLERNQDGTFPDRHFWALDVDEDDIIMLNADISLIRRLEMDKNEKVLCAFERSRSNPVTLPLCPYVESALRLVAQYKHDELDFLHDFRDVLSRMMRNGYTTPDCDDAICKLSS